MINEIRKKEANIVSEIDKITTEDYSNFVYKKLLFYYEKSIPVHFSMIQGGWVNGLILELDEEYKMVILKEFLNGKMSFLCNEIKLHTISAYGSNKKDGTGDSNTTK
jgi:hypothetical protein